MIGLYIRLENNGPSLTLKTDFDLGWRRLLKCLWADILELNAIWPHKYLA